MIGSPCRRGGRRRKAPGETGSAEILGGLHVRVLRGGGAEAATLLAAAPTSARPAK